MSFVTLISFFSSEVLTGLWLVRNLHTNFFVSIDLLVIIYSYNCSRLIIACYFYSSSKKILLILLVTLPLSKPYWILSRNTVTVSGNVDLMSWIDFNYSWGSNFLLCLFLIALFGSLVWLVIAEIEWVFKAPNDLDLANLFITLS